MQRARREAQSGDTLMATLIDPNASILDVSERVEVTQRELDKTIEVYERISRRRRPHTIQDDDEVERALSPASNDGFWKHDEYLKCRRGTKMISDYRGLPPGYFVGIRS